MLWTRCSYLLVIPLLVTGLVGCTDEAAPARILDSGPRLADGGPGPAPEIDPLCSPTRDGSCRDLCDLDSDGHRSERCGGDDCNDGNAVVHPGHAEVCDDWDNDCNQLTDDGLVGCHSTICRDEIPSFGLTVCAQGEVCCDYGPAGYLDGAMTACSISGECRANVSGLTLVGQSECDGPEDCSSGEVCCEETIWSGLAITGRCKLPSECVQALRRNARCHTNADCPTGLSCDVGHVPLSYPSDTPPTGACR